MKGFDPQWRDFPDYIVGITELIWEGHGVGTLNRYYAPDIPVRTPMGLARGNRATIAGTMATQHEFPDRALYAEDVIWCGDDTTGYLSSHRTVSTGTHTADGLFGKATGKRFTIRVIADCAARADVIDDEWLVRDYGGLVRQLGHEPRDFAHAMIEREGGPGHCQQPFTPAIDEPGPYQSGGNDNPWGERYAALLGDLMNHEFDRIATHHDRAVQVAYAGAVNALGHDPAAAFWIGLRSAFPDATFRIHHRIGMDGGMMPPRAAVRFSLDGTHSGWGRFGEPTGARVHVMGIAHAEFGPFTARGSTLAGSVRRECVMIDDVAIWKQILMQTGFPAP